MNSMFSVYASSKLATTISPSCIVRLVNTSTLSASEMFQYFDGTTDKVIKVSESKGVPLDNFIEFDNLAKLNYIYCVLQRMQDGNQYGYTIRQALEYVEDIRDTFERLYPIPVETSAPTR